MVHAFHLAVSRMTGLLPTSVPLSSLADRRRNTRRFEVRRRPGKVQGRALEILAHALEYLVDTSTERSPADQEAVQILAARSRAVFAECPEIRPLFRRITSLLPSFLTLPAIEDESVPSRMYRASDETPRVSRDESW